MEERGTTVDDGTITVLLQEEYGYRLWVWETGMTAFELEAWWSSCESLHPYFFTPVGLPGDLIQVFEDLSVVDAKRIALHERWQQGELTKAEMDAQITTLYQCHRLKLVRVEGDAPAPAKQPDWWSGHIHEEDDSHLKTSEGRIIVHAGYARASAGDADGTEE